MTLAQYELFVNSQSRNDLDLNYAIIALNEEAGECAGWYKKYVLRGNPTGKYEREDLAKELGDLLFYLTRTAGLMGWSVTDIMDWNKEKLEARRGKGLRQVV